MLYLICGIPGTGKTTFARKLAANMRAELFSLDNMVVRKYGRNNKNDLELREKSAKYELLPNVEHLLRTGHSVVLDYGFFKKFERDRYKMLARNCNSDVVLYYLVTDYSTCLKRVTARNKVSENIHFIDKKILDALIERFERPVDEGQVVIDSGLSTYTELFAA